MVINMATSNNLYGNNNNNNNNYDELTAGRRSILGFNLQEIW
jgi:hypothetical protein